MGSLADKYGVWRVLLIGATVEVFLWPLPAFMHDLLSFGVAWTLLNGVGSGVFALSFSALSRSTADSVRGRVMSFAYLPVNVGSFVGPAIGSLVTQGSVMTVFPVAGALTAIGIVLMAWAHRKPV
jgi:MFS family permease